MKNKSGFMIKVQVYYNQSHVGYGYIFINHKYQTRQPMLFDHDGKNLPANWYELKYESEMIPVIINERVN